MTPRACARWMRLLTFCPANGVSMATAMGVVRAMTAVSSSWIRQRRSARSAPRLVVIDPCSMRWSCPRSASMTPNPVVTEPGSTPRMRTGGIVSCAVVTDIAINPRETGLAPLDFAALFGNDHRVVLEIGSGKGRFLIASAVEQPDVNFIGIEKSLHYHRVIAERINKRSLTNVRLINYDAFPVLQKMIPDASLAEVHIYFPDPWPRKREQKRRIIRAQVMVELRRGLIDGGGGGYR